MPHQSTDQPTPLRLVHVSPGNFHVPVSVTAACPVVPVTVTLGGWKERPVGASAPAIALGSTTAATDPPMTTHDARRSRRARDGNPLRRAVAASVSLDRPDIPFIPPPEVGLRCGSRGSATKKVRASLSRRPDARTRHVFRPRQAPPLVRPPSGDRSCSSPAGRNWSDSPATPALIKP